MNQVYIKDKIFKKIFYLGIFFLLTLVNICYSIENKILVKVNNEIITSIDIENETKYLIALNPSIENLIKDKIFIISKKSLIKEKIKRIEINKNYIKIEPPENYVDTVIQNIYQNIGLKSLDNFKKYLEIKGVNYEIVKKKIEIEAVWNQLIFTKFSEKIKIDKEKIKNSILKNKNKKIKSLLMSEIIFEIKNLSDLDSKYLEIKKIIDSKGFDNAALSFSISNTAQIGGRLNWINENSLNKNLKKKIQDLEIGKYTGPISVSGGFLILQLNEEKNIKNDKKIDLKIEVNKKIRLETNKQLNQLSTLHFNKVKKDIQIYEF
mgnify:CR=1 FL=1|jgi:peptidyl-prolyl cis-trans isomerase SurA